MDETKINHKGKELRVHDAWVSTIRGWHRKGKSNSDIVFELIHTWEFMNHCGLDKNETIYIDEELVQKILDIPDPKRR